MTSAAQEILAGANEIGHQYNEALKQKISEKELEVYFKVLETILHESKNIELNIERGK